MTKAQITRIINKSIVNRHYHFTNLLNNIEMYYRSKWWKWKGTAKNTLHILKNINRTQTCPSVDTNSYKIKQF
jgi:hypothetical protein